MEPSRIVTLQAQAAIDQAHAAWVQAWGSIGAVVAALLIVLLQALLAWREKRQDRYERRSTIRFVLDLCVQEYRNWTSDVETAMRHKLLEETISLRHLDVALERLLAEPVGDTRFNSALIRMRKINADVFVQIEKARNSAASSETNKVVDLAGPARQIRALLNQAEQVRGAVPD